MSKRVLLVACGLLVAAPAPASAASSFCSETGDYCTSARERTGAVRLVLSTFSFTGKVRTCVTPPTGTRTCKSFTLRRTSDGINAVDVRWSAHFPRGGPGTYRVTFAPTATGGTTLGPTLTFRRRS